MEKKNFYMIGSAVILIFAVMSFSNQSQPTTIIQQKNGSTTQNPTNVTYDLGNVNWMAWMVAGGAVLWVIWQRRNESTQKPYKDTMEATEDLKKKARDHGFFPVIIEQQDFSDRDSKMEFFGTFKCTNTQSPYKGRPIPFIIRKNGVFKYDLTKLYYQEMQDKKTIEVQTKKKEVKK